jgi:predicted nucleotidyltransferase
MAKRSGFGFWHSGSLAQPGVRVVRLYRGRGGPDSDADLLVVIRVAGSKRQQAVQIDLALEGIAIPIDLVVVTPEDVDKDRDTIGSIIREAVREGKVLYERAA